jgi:hypothetical protein
MKMGCWWLMILISGWWFQPTSLKNDGFRQLGWWLFPTEWKNIIHVPNHQPGIHMFPIAGIFPQARASIQLRFSDKTLAMYKSYLCTKPKVIGWSTWELLDPKHAQILSGTPKTQVHLFTKQNRKISEDP